MSLFVPTTWLSAFLLLIVSFICLGSWANTVKLAGPRWRFELFSVDFAIGALLCSLLAAYTLGTLGSELDFGDRMLVAGRLAQAVAVAGGALLALGNVLLLSSVSLIGMTAAFPLSIATALAVTACFKLSSDNFTFLAPGIVLLIMTAIFIVIAIRSIPDSGPRFNASKPAERRLSRATKGIIVGLISGLPLGCFYPVVQRSISGDFGLGPYAGTLMMTAGFLPATLVLSFFFMNIAIDGEPLALTAYFQGQAGQHLYGLAGGAVWAAGLLSLMLAILSPTDIGPNLPLRLILPLASALLTALWGSGKWNEYAQAPNAIRKWLFASAACFLGGLLLVGLGFAR